MSKTKTKKPAKKTVKVNPIDDNSEMAAYFLNRFPQFMPRGAIVQYDTGYDDLLYYCKDKEEVYKAALHILVYLSDGADFEEDHDEIPDPGLTPETIAALPNATLRKEGELMLQRYNERIKCQRDSNAEVRAVNKALKEKNGGLAYNCLKRGYCGFDKFKLIEPVDFTKF